MPFFSYYRQIAQDIRENMADGIIYFGHLKEGIGYMLLIMCTPLVEFATPNMWDSMVAH